MLPRWISPKIYEMRRWDGCARWVLIALSLWGVGCSDETLSGAPSSSGWSMLVEGDWTLESGDEGYKCARVTLQEDVWIGAFRPISPLGTHHTILSVDRNVQNAQPDGTYPCDATTNGQNMLFASGVGTATVELPEGVAIKVEKGTSLILNLHLFNVTPQTLNHRSGVEVLRVDAADVVHEAEIILAGKVDGLVVPPGKSTQLGVCEISHDVTVFAVLPHMHQLGSHLKATAIPASGSPTVLLDAPYSFDEQVYYDVNPTLALKAGERVEVECSYENPGAETITFGDSSLQEMCFAGLYRYPRSDGGMVCSTSTGPTIDGPPCAKPGDPGNEKGIGKLCSEGGGECGGSAPLCIADYADGDFANFCTLVCTDSSECGSGAICLGNDETSVCLPSACLATLD